MKEIKLVSLFSGAGGLDLGFNINPFKLMACVEIEEIFCETLRINKGRYLPEDIDIYNEDIKEFTPPETWEDADFIIGGPPCQAFSAAARRLGGNPGLKGETGGLFENFCYIVDQAKPKGFLFENVKGLLYSNREEAWNLVQKSFSKLGYNLFYRVLDTASYGVPQRRERVILIGVREEEEIEFKFPMPTHGTFSPKEKPYVTTWDAIGDIQDPDEPYHEYDGKYGHLLSEIPEGMNYSYFTEKMNHPDPVFAWRSKFHDFLYKIHRDKPVRTLQAQPGKFSGPFHWKNRKLTIEELKRLQTFPDDYELAGGRGKKIEQIGNSVPPKFAEIMAKAVAYQIFECDEHKVELMSKDYELSYTSEKRREMRELREKIKKQLKERKEAKENTSNQKLEKEKGEIVHFKSLTEKSFFSRKKHETDKQIDIYEVEKEDDKLFPSSYQLLTKENSENVLIEIASLGAEKQGFINWRAEIKSDNYINNKLKKIEGAISCSNPKAIVILWSLIEEEIKRRTSYLSLVGLYGHFSERRNSVEFNVENKDQIEDFKENSGMIRILSFISKPENCGHTYKISSLSSKLNIGENYLVNAAKELKRFKYDIRIYNENDNSIFFGYPFPLLSREFQVSQVN